MADEGNTFDAELAAEVFDGAERWGWEYVPPPTPLPHPAAARPPEWTEPFYPELARLQAEEAGRRGKAGVPVAVVVIGVCAVFNIFLALVLAVVGGVVLAATRPSRRVETARRAALADRDRRLAEHQQLLARWNEELEQHRQEQVRTSATLDTWYPVVLRSRPARVDVIGGSRHGWASLLAGVGGSVLTAGDALVVADLTEQRVALELFRLTRLRGIPVAHLPFPGTSLDADLLAGTTPENLAETIADALATLRPAGADGDLRTVDTALLRTVTTRLRAPLTYHRLAAGLAVLLRQYEPGTAGAGPLAREEVIALTEAIDTVGTGERRRNELHYLKDLVDAFLGGPAPVDSASEPSAPWWRPGQLTVVSTSGPGRHRKDIADRMLLARLTHGLDTLAREPRQGTLVLAGADRLGRDALEALALRARQAGVRLLLLLEHLRDGTEALAGGPDSATVFMRLGNGEEAKAAADFIGRQHTLVLTQLTRQFGETLSEGRGLSTGEQHGTTSASSTGDIWSSSHGSSLSHSWQQSVHSSRSLSTTTGETTSRVYDFTVEPTQLQALPPTGFVLVETTSRTRRVVFGDCNPAISLLPRVSATPR
ncbi:hypothetical protein ACFY9F_22900 [Streptomyces sp. NPDC012421]|uniref:hypothetical protein n=1 Tax=Streptomyces sp. NPDC012421 TaxID=3364832 RepID=UPI0036E215A5